jgi:hypothetical protein
MYISSHYLVLATHLAFLRFMIDFFLLAVNVGITKEYSSLEGLRSRWPLLQKCGLNLIAVNQK